MYTSERGLWALVGFLTGGVVVSAFYVMLHMEPGSRSQGGRFYVVIAALVVLAVLDKQIERLVIRLAPFSLRTTGPERRYAAISLLLWLVSAVVLLGGAWLLP